MGETAPRLSPVPDRDRLAKRTSALAEIAQTIAASLDFSQAFPAAAKLARQVLPFDLLMILLVEDEPASAAVGRLSLAFSYSCNPDNETTANADLRLPAHFSYSETLLANSPVIVADMDVTSVEQIGAQNVLNSAHAALMVPIFAPPNVLGGLVLVSQTPDSYSVSDLLLAEPIADLFAVALEHQRLNRQSCTLAIAEERNRLAREIHDTLAQSLAGIIINLESLKPYEAARAHAFAEVLVDTEALARRALEEARRSVFGLHPLALEHHSLREALAEELTGLARRNGLTTHFYYDGQERPLAPELATALFRIAQEAFQNIHKHSAARHVILGLVYELEAIVLTVEDDGVGFLPNTQMPSERGGFGLVVMTQRAHTLGGELGISSRPRHGTVVRAKLPYALATVPLAAPVTAAEATTASQRPIRVLIVDNHTTARQGIRRILEGNADIEIVGEAEDGFGAIEQTACLRPDVVLLDVQMPRLSGIEALSQLRTLYPSVEVVMLTMFSHDEAVFASLRAGARGYVLKDAPPAMFEAAVRAAHQGQSLLPPLLTTRVVDRLAVLTQAHVAADALTIRELEVLQGMAKGLRYKEIAVQLSVTSKTVGYHVTNIFQKLQVGSRAEAVVVAAERGLLGQIK